MQRIVAGRRAAAAASRWFILPPEYSYAGAPTPSWTIHSNLGLQRESKCIRTTRAVWFSSINQRGELNELESDAEFQGLQKRSEDDISLEKDVERKAGWILKLIFVGTASLLAFQFFPYMGDGLLRQSVSLLHIKDPLYKRMGASRLSRFAVDDERRMRVVEIGGAHGLLNMLKDAKDDKTRKQALKALVALSQSDEATEALDQAGAVPIVACTPDSIQYPEVERYKSSLLRRFEDLKSQQPEMQVN